MTKRTGQNRRNLSRKDFQRKISKILSRILSCRLDMGQGKEELQYNKVTTSPEINVPI